MKPHQSRLSVSFSLLLGLAACGGAGPAAPSHTPPAGDPLQKFVLTADPGEAVDVMAQKQKGPADQVVVRGRIAAVTKGLAMFQIMDLSLPYCGENDPSHKCDTPWDWCCEKKETRTANLMVVELHGADGQPITAAKLPDLQLLDAVKVKGKLTKDEAGNFVLAATGVFRTQRPKLPDGIKIPE